MKDYKKYPPNWKTEIVPRILKRANNKCEKCELKNYSLVYSARLYLRDSRDNRYRLKQIWFTTKGGFERMRGWIYQNTYRMVKVILTISHLDHDETNWDVKDDRLMAMCQMCHLTYDGKEKIRRIAEKSRQKRLDMKRQNILTSKDRRI